MKITSETLPERQVRLQIEVDEERHAEAMEQAYRKLAPRVSIRGFRPGKAPRPLIEKTIGHHRLLDEAMDIIIPIAYSQALEEQSIKPIASPEVELVSHEPLVFTATVPLEPVVDLKDYKDQLRVEGQPVSVPDGAVDDELEEMRHRNGTIEPVDRAAKEGDVIRGSLSAETDDDGQVFAGQDLEYRLTEDYLVSMPGLLQAIAGKSKGDEFDAKSIVPEDFPDERLRGKEIRYKVKIDEVKEEQLAPLDDSLAQGHDHGDSITTLAELRKHLEDDLLKAAETGEQRRVEAAAIDALTDMASVEYPAVMLEAEISHILEEQAGMDPRDPRAQEVYLARLGKNEEEVRASVRDEAEGRLKRSLVMREFAEAENISVDESDVDQELQNLAGQAGTSHDVILRLFGNEQGRAHLRQTILTRKTFGRLAEIAGSEPAEKPAATKKAPAKARRTSPRATGEATTEEAKSE